MLKTCKHCGTNIFVFAQPGSAQTVVCKHCKAEMCILNDGNLEIKSAPQGSIKPTHSMPIPLPVASAQSLAPAATLPTNPVGLLTDDLDALDEQLDGALSGNISATAMPTTGEFDWGGVVPIANGPDVEALATSTPHPLSRAVTEEIALQKAEAEVGDGSTEHLPGWLQEPDPMDKTASSETPEEAFPEPSMEAKPSPTENSVDVDVDVDEYVQPPVVVISSMENATTLPKPESKRNTTAVTEVNALAEIAAAAAVFEDAASSEPDTAQHFLGAPPMAVSPELQSTDARSVDAPTAQPSSVYEPEAEAEGPQAVAPEPMQAEYTHERVTASFDDYSADGIDDNQDFDDLGDMDDFDAEFPIPRRSRARAALGWVTAATLTAGLSLWMLGLIPQTPSPFSDAAHYLHSAEPVVGSLNIDSLLGIKKTNTDTAFSTQTENSAEKVTPVETDTMRIGDTKVDQEDAESPEPELADAAPGAPQPQAIAKSKQKRQSRVAKRTRKKPHTSRAPVVEAKPIKEVRKNTPTVASPRKIPEPKIVQAIPKKQNMDHYKAAAELMRQKKITLAITELKKSISQHPRHAASHRMLGVAYTMLKRERSAVLSFEQYIRLSPNAADAAKLRAAINNYHQRNP